MSSVLFLNQPAVGHLNTLLGIARQMKADGHRVHFLVPGARVRKTNIKILDIGLQIPDRIKAYGLGCDVIPLSFSALWNAVRLPFKSGYDEIIHALNMFSRGIEHYTHHILKFIESYRPTILVTDFAFPAASLAADMADIPYVVIYHSGLPFRGDSIPPFGSGQPISTDYLNLDNGRIRKENRVLKKLDQRINRARRNFGLKPIAEDMLRRPYSPWLNLVPSATIIEAPRNNMSRNTLFIGPCINKQTMAGGDFPFETLRDDKYKIYVSLGTVFNNKPEVFQKIMRALDTPKYQVLISAGGAYQNLQRGGTAENISVFRSVPQMALLPKVDLFISHGGNNSINEALASGKPIIVMPVGGEQGDNASRVIYLDVGKRVDMSGFTEKQLLSEVESIRTNPKFQENALAIKMGLKGTQSVVTASRCIDWVAQKKKPLQNRKGAPLTITSDTLNLLLGD